MEDSPSTWEEVPFATSSIDLRPLITKSAIWCSTPDCLVEFCLQTNSIKSTTPYPDDFYCSSLCLHDSTIYLIDGSDMRMILMFDCVSKQFVQTALIPKIGAANSVVIGDYIHIFHCCDLPQLHIVYDIRADNVIEMVHEDHREMNETWYPETCSLRYKDMIVAFGGRNRYLSVCSTVSVPPFGQIEWELKKNWKVPFVFPNFISYGNLLIVFRGETDEGDEGDEIYVLDLSNKDEGWLEVKNCRLPASLNSPTFHACLDLDKELVHVFQITMTRHTMTRHTRHFCISLDVILKDFKHKLTALSEREMLKVNEYADYKSKSIVSGFIRGMKCPNLPLLIPRICLAFFYI